LPTTPALLIILKSSSSKKAFTLSGIGAILASNLFDKKGFSLVYLLKMSIKKHLFNALFPRFPSSTFNVNDFDFLPLVTIVSLLSVIRKRALRPFQISKTIILTS